MLLYSQIETDQCILCLSQMDLQDIADRYKELYDCKLKRAIRNETSGDYKKLLMKIMDQAAAEDDD